MAALECITYLSSFRATGGVASTTEFRDAKRGGGDRLAHFVGQKTLSPFVSNELEAVTREPLLFKTDRGATAYGYDATVLADICEAILEARRYIEDGEARAFCPVRYGCSINLAQLLNHHVGGKAYEGRDRNGAKNHFFYAEADGVAYPIFFRLGVATKIPHVHGVLHIISAYQNANLPPRHKLQSVKFARLVHQKCRP